MSSPDRVILTLDSLESQGHFRRLASVTYGAGVVLMVLGDLASLSRKVDKRIVSGISLFVLYPRLLFELVRASKRQTSIQFFAHEIYNISSALLKQRFKVLDIILDNEIAFLVARGLVDIFVDDSGVYLSLTLRGQEIVAAWLNGPDFLRLHELATEAISVLAKYDADSLFKEVRVLAMEASK